MTVLAPRAPAAAPSGPARRVPVRALRWVAGAVVVVAVVLRLGTGPVLDGIRAVSPDALALALAIGAVTTTASAARWCVVARGLGLRIGFGAAVGDCYRAQFLNSVLPAGVLGDVHRAVDHGRRAGDLGGGVRAVVLERVAGQVVVVVAGVTVLLAVPSPVRGLVAGLGVAGLVPVALVPVALVAAALVAALLGVAAFPRVRRGLAELVAGTREALLTRRSGPAVLGLSVVAMAGHLALLAVAALAVGVRTDPVALVPLLVLPLLAMGLPLNVGGWGPREATTAVSFGVAGLGAATGLATAVAFGVLALVSTLPGLAVLLLRAGPGSGDDQGPVGRYRPTVVDEVAAAWAKWMRTAFPRPTGSAAANGSVVPPTTCSRSTACAPSVSTRSSPAPAPRR